ncbi:hypothetical protein, partial [Klebsiella pneumoniae]
RNHCFFHNILSHVSCYESHSGWHNEPGMTLGISLKNVFDLQPWQKMLPPRAPCRRWHNFQHVCYIL